MPTAESPASDDDYEQMSNSSPLDVSQDDTRLPDSERDSAKKGTACNQELSNIDTISDNVPLTLSSAKSLLPRIFDLTMHLTCVYFLEFTIITAFAKGMQDRVRAKYPEEYENEVMSVRSFNDVI